MGRGWDAVAGEVMQIRDEARAVMAQERVRNGQSPLSSPGQVSDSLCTATGGSPAVGTPGVVPRAAATVAAAAIDLVDSDNDTSPPSEVCQLSEVVGDLFAKEYRSGEGVCHCVSQCLSMGKGIATHFKRKYGGVPELKAQHVEVGGVATLKRNGAWIYYL